MASDPSHNGGDDLPIDLTRASKLFTPGLGVTYDDFTIPHRFTDFPAHEVDLSTQFTRDIRLRLGFVSAPMDTVTEADYAIWMALLGGIGVLHFNYSTRQAQLVDARRVKRFQNGFIANPVTLSPDNTIGDLVKIREEQGISTVPLTENGEPNGKLVGMITEADYSKMVHPLDMKIIERMIHRCDLVVECTDHDGAPIELEKANRVLLESHNTYLPIVDRETDELRYLVTRTDIERAERFPLATMDSHNRLRVFIAVSTREEDMDIIQEAARIGVDGVVLDSSHGDSLFQVEMLRYIKSECGSLQVVAGNIATVSAAKRLIDEGADALRVGEGPGTSCITGEQTPSGRAQGSAVYHTARYARTRGIPVIADGGIDTIGKITKAYVVGGSTAMMGNLLAGTDESPGKVEYVSGQAVKRYRGMASEEALRQGGEKRYPEARVPQGVAGWVDWRGPAAEWIRYLVNGVNQSMQGIGCRDIETLHETVFGRDEHIFERRTAAGTVETRPHGMHVTPTHHRP